MILFLILSLYPKKVAIETSTVIFFNKLKFKQIVSKKYNQIYHLLYTKIGQ
jgi:hypothetical protein